MPMTMSGMASGIDTDNVIKKLVEIEKKPIRRLEMTQAELSHEIDALSGVRERAKKLQLALKSLYSYDAAFEHKALHTSPEGFVSGIVNKKAPLGEHKLKVERLASKFSARSEKLGEDFKLPRGKITINNKKATFAGGTLIAFKDFLNEHYENDLSAKVIRLDGENSVLILESKTEGPSGVPQITDHDGLVQKTGLYDPNGKVKPDTEPDKNQENNKTAENKAQPDENKTEEPEPEKEQKEQSEENKNKDPEEENLALLFTLDDLVMIKEGPFEITAAKTALTLEEKAQRRLIETAPDKKDRKLKSLKVHWNVQVAPKVEQKPDTTPFQLTYGPQKKLNIKGIELHTYNITRERPKPEPQPEQKPDFGIVVHYKADAANNIPAKEMISLAELSKQSEQKSENTPAENAGPTASKETKPETEKVNEASSKEPDATAEKKASPPPPPVNSDETTQPAEAAATAANESNNNAEVSAPENEQANKDKTAGEQNTSTAENNTETANEQAEQDLQDGEYEIALKARPVFVDFYVEGVKVTYHDLKWVYDIVPPEKEPEKNPQENPENKPDAKPDDGKKPAEPIAESKEKKEQKAKFPHLVRAGEKSRVMIDGVAVEREKNTSLDDIIDGVSLNLHQTSEDEIDATITHNSEKAVEQIESFVEAYNDLLKYSKEQSKHSSADKPWEYKNKLQDQGILTTNSSVRGLVNGLKSKVSSAYPALRDPQIRILTTLGITTGDVGASWEDISDGYLQLDKAKLQEMLENHPVAVKEFFAIDSNGDRRLDNGFAYTTEEFLEPYTRYTRGLISEQIKSKQNRIKDLNKEKVKIEEHIAKYEEKLRSKFGHMESSVRQQKATGDYLKNKLGGGKK